MKYFKNTDDGEVYGYDENEDTQLPYIERAIEAGWEDITGSWPPPEDPAEVFERAKATAMQQAEFLTQNKRKAIAGTFDAFDVAGWATKLRIAQAIKAKKANDKDKAALLSELEQRSIPGETLDAFVEKILQNGAGYSMATGKIDGIKKATRMAIESATTQDELDAALQRLGETIEKF